MNDSEKPKSSWRERRQSIKHKWAVPFVYVEWRCEQFSYLLGRWAFLEILGHIGRFSVLASIVIGVGVYWWEAPKRKAQAEDQRKAKHYQAWQVINTAQGKPGIGGRIDALQDLNRDGISLAGVDISKAYLPKLNLENADLFEANLIGAYLWDANLAEAVLWKANLAGAYLVDSNLTEADLVDANLAEAILVRANLTEASLLSANLTRAALQDANLTEAYLKDANLTRATLGGANLTRATLGGANLTGANLGFANLTGADLGFANLTEANLSDANLAEAYIQDANLAGTNLQHSNLRGIRYFWQKIKSIELANIYDVKNPPDGFIEWAKKHGAVNIEDKEEWIKLVREKRQEKTKEK